MVGHNCLLDLMYFYQNFIADLPEQLEEFIHNFSFYFPKQYDTKAMAETLNLFQRTDLQTMSLKCVTDKRWRNYLEFEQDLAHGFRKYAGKVALHEAGYDSYITGIAFASMVKQLEVQTFVEWTKIKAREDVGLDANISAEVLACRTGRDFAVPLPEAKNLVELTSSKLNLGCATEFCNYILFAMEGQRALRLEAEYWRHEQITDHKNVIYIELRKNLTAYQVCEVVCEFADIYVMKDSPTAYFVEIQWVDEVRYPQCKTAKDVIRAIVESGAFGKTKMRDARGNESELPVMAQCLTYMDSLYHRRSLPQE